MRGIAEYFRDLAADDRYFGAEPPTPDADMLHRIAEREIQRRVEARVENNGIILRQMEDHGKAAPKEPEPAAAAPVAASAAPVAATAGLTAAAAPQPAPQPDVEAYDFTDAIPARGESVAAKLARIRAAVARREDDAGQTYRDDSHIADTLPSATLAEAFEDAEIAPEPEAAAEPAEPETLTIEDEPVEVVVDESVAASFEDETEEPQVDETEDALAEEDLDEPEMLVLTDDAEDEEDEPEVVETTDALAEEELGEPGTLVLTVDAEEDEDEASEEETIAFGEQDLDEGDFDEDGIEEDEAVELAETSFEDIAESTLVAEEDEDEDEALVASADGLAEDLEEDEEPQDDEVGRDAVSRVMGQLPEDDAEEDALPEEEEASDAPDAPAIARVIKMRRSDIEEDAEIEETDASEAFELGTPEDDENDKDMNFSFLGSDDEDADEAAEDLLDEADEETAADLSDEDEADLMATLEQVQRESEADGRADKEGRAVLERQDLEDNGNGVKRILEVTNTELEETEGTRRRSAIQHLKAAVLATRADKKLSKEKAEVEDAKQLDQYREDLARVVRPRRPVDGVKSTERRQAPLVLVSEQRIDTPELPVDPNAEAVRPRRVSASVAIEADDRAAEDQASDDDVNENIFTDAESFADFAEQMGATELPDLLEAAAAYASYVEGRPHFSRPQIMRAVASFRDEDFNREDSLRSFGQLLRHGKIRKLSRGQFTVAQSTRFNPGARAAGE